MALLLDAYPETMGTVVDAAAAAGELANVAFVWADEQTGKTVSRTWGELDPETRDLIRGGAKVVAIVVPAGSAGKIGKTLRTPNTGTGARFADQAKLDDHFIRHGADFGATSPSQYQQMADNFLTGPRGTNTLERIRPNGDVVRYDPTTDAFGVVSSNGTVRTYYVPDPTVHGYATNLDYFNAQ